MALPDPAPTLQKELVQLLQTEIQRLKQSCMQHWYRMREAQMELEAARLTHARAEMALQDSQRVLVRQFIKALSEVVADQPSKEAQADLSIALTRKLTENGVPLQLGFVAYPPEE